jgi:cohesin loading factor subunit SCC2
MPVQLYSEELITACLGTIKNQLTRLIYPFVEACADESSHANLLLQQLVDATTAASKDHRRQLYEIFQALSAVLPRLSVLVGSESVALSDMIIIQAVYIAIGPFFVVESKSNSDNKLKKLNINFNTLGKNAMRVLRLDALSLIRNVNQPSERCTSADFVQIFANYEDQRSWIVEEILMSLIKLSDAKQKAGQFR